MRRYIVSTLFLLFIPPAWTQTVPSGWKVVKDSKGVCQIAVPPEWVPYHDNTGAAARRYPRSAQSLDLRPPEALPHTETNVVTRKKLPAHRKSR
jgi:hypothetical protein